eukprot:TRINITY_DN4240_c0_g1_i1.p2 TRINITY_DN4240_c0_g1~~TRINITY_DN4240_c0_g1_i1.p2  ORF type:complete len:154 (-),score=42.63 TRINITY_DN4240_c0_g1_i1:137-598(-)
MDCSCCETSGGSETVTAVTVKPKPTAVKEEIKEEVKETAPAPEPETSATPEPEPAATPEPEPAATPAPSVKFSFELPDKKTVELDFKERPIGIDFRRRTPMTVKAIKPNTPAQEMNVGSDWLLTHVDREKLPDDFNKIMELIDSKVSVLPRRS